MIPQTQRTLRRAARFEGIGLHTGAPCTLHLLPAPPGSGLRFVRTDLPDRPSIPVRPESASVKSRRLRRTVLAAGGAEVHTVEHVLAAVSGLALDNLVLEMSALEAPEPADGSARALVARLLEAGIEDQGVPRDFAVITEPLFLEEEGVQIVGTPHPGLRLSFTIQYPNPVVGTQHLSIDMTPEAFAEQVAPARTFALWEDLEALRAAGMIKGGTLENAVVVRGHEVLNQDGLRFPDEFVRHKILDLLGDLAVLGRPLRGHIHAVRSGHDTNVRFVRRIRESVGGPGSGNGGVPGAAAGGGGEAPAGARGGGAGAPARPGPAAFAGPPDAAETGDAQRWQEHQALLGQIHFDIGAIERIMPHRYPMLLVDRILRLEERRRVVGIKNVSVNEAFFAGHFPGHPIMPAVLILEAMAQVGGILLLYTVENPESKLVYFMGIDQAKFRKPVLPGDQVVFDLELVRLKSRICKMNGKAYVRGALVAEAELLSTIVDR